MRKRFLKSVLTTSLVATLLLGCPTMGSTSSAAEDDVVQDAIETNISIEEEIEPQKDTTEGLESQTMIADSEIVVYASTDVSINATNFPDAAFRQYVKDNIDTDGNGVLSTSEISKCTEIRCSWNKDITSLKGIEFFYNLENLDCEGNNLSNLDVSKNTALKSLDCYGNKLSSLDVSKNTALTTLNCGLNNLKSLDVSKNILLTNLNCGSNSISNLDVSKNTKLITLSCGYNNLSSLNVSKNTALESLYCSANSLTSLDVSKNSKLFWLGCMQNNISSLDVTKNAALKELMCGENNISSLDVSKNTELEILGCHDNNLNNIDVSKNTKIYFLFCWGNNFSSVDTSKIIRLEKYILLNTPVVNTPTKVSVGVKVSWSKSIGADGYYVYRRVKGGSWKKIATVYDLSYIDNSVSAGATYEYTVKGFYHYGVPPYEPGDQGYVSGYEKNGKSITLNLSTPKISSVSNVNGGVKISWDKVDGAAKYRVYYKTGSGSWKKLTDTTSTSYTWKNAKSGTKYTFTVRCMSSDGKTATSSYNKTGKTILCLSQPKISKIEANNSGVKITWGKVTGATKYRVYYKSSNGWKMLKETTGTSCTINSRKGKSYQYTVKALNGNYASSYHSGTSFNRLETPKLSGVSNTSTGVKISWGKVTGAAKYRVYYKTGSGKWTKVADTTSTSYTWTGAKKGTTYTFTVRCLSSDKKVFTSGYDSTGKKITYTGK